MRTFSVPSPDGEVFFLAPRLVEFPDAVLDASLLLPVQSPFSESWSKLSVSALSSYLLSQVNEKYESLVHTHDNLSILNKFSVDSSGRLLFDGEAVGGDGGITDISGLVTLATEQTITAKKTFAGDVVLGGQRQDGSYGRAFVPSHAGPGVYDLYISSEPIAGEIPSGSGGIDETELWSILGTSGTQQIDASHMSNALAGYATQQWVQQQGYLTSSALTPYATKEWVEQQGYLTEDDLGSLDGYVTLATISDLHASWDALLKAAKPTTLAGYGITNAYTQSEVDTKLSAYLPLAGGTMNDGAEIKFSFYGGARVLRIHEGLNWDMSNTPGGYANVYAQHIDPAGASYTGMGVYGDVNGLMCFFLGGSYTSPWMVLTPSGNVGIGTTAPAYKLDVVGKIRATTGITIGSTDDIGWYYTSGSRICAGQTTARGVNVGSLLVSNIWTDYTKVPENGIYSKGDIWTGGRLYVPSYSGNQVYDLYISNAPVSGEAPSGSSGIDEAELWSILTDGAGGERIAKSHLPLDVVYDADLDGYALRTGTNATGTWPISVSGSAAWLVNSDPGSFLDRLVYHIEVGGEVGSTEGGGVWGVPSDSQDAQYGQGQYIRMGWPSGTYYTDIYTGPNNAGTARGLQWRQVVADNVVNATHREGWRLLLDTLNYPATLDGRYLLKSTYTAADVLAKIKTVDGAGSGLDADLLDGTQKSGLLTSVTSTSATNLSVTVGGKTISVADLYAASATKLQTARTLWGQSFDGMQNVSGNMTGVGSISMNGSISGATSITASANIKASDFAGAYISDNAVNYFVGNAEDGVGSGKSGLLLYAYGSKGIYLYTNSEQRMVVNASGNVGIGTTAPAYNLDVAGTGRFTNSLTVGGYLYIGDSHLYTNASIGLGFGVGGTTRLMLTDSELRYSNTQLALGTSSQRWSSVYSVAGNFSGAVSIGSTLGVSGTATVGNLIATGRLYVPSYSGNQVYDLYVSNAPVSGTAPELAAEVETLKILSTAMEAHLSFSATSYAYLVSQGDFAFIPDGQSTSASRADLIVSNGYVRPGSTGVTYLGMSTARWATLYCGSANLSATLYVSGDSTMAGDLTVRGELSNPTTSSRKVKDIVTPATSYSQRLAEMGKVIDYRYNSKVDRDRNIHTGLVYENVRDVFPAMCSERDGYGSLNYYNTDYINMVVGAVQEHTEEIEALRRRVSTLERELEKLRA